MVRKEFLIRWINSDRPGKLSYAIATGCSTVLAMFVAYWGWPPSIMRGILGSLAVAYFASTCVVEIVKIRRQRVVHDRKDDEAQYPS